MAAHYDFSIQTFDFPFQGLGFSTSPLNLATNHPNGKSGFYFRGIWNCHRRSVDQIVGGVGELDAQGVAGGPGDQSVHGCIRIDFKGVNDGLNDPH
jgi:hypothetical protein